MFTLADSLIFIFDEIVQNVVFGVFWLNFICIYMYMYKYKEHYFLQYFRVPLNN